MPSDPTPPDEQPLPAGVTINLDGSVNLPIRTCPKCGAMGVAFICDTRGCLVNGGAAYG
jgi:hypothetical protein